jgi:hypothetical protein
MIILKTKRNLNLAWALALALGALMPQAAQAQPGDVTSSPPPPPAAPVDGLGHHLSVTFSPLDLIPISTDGFDIPFGLDVSVERALSRKLSVMVTGLAAPYTYEGQSAAILGTRAQGRYYLFGGFEHGMDLALEGSLAGTTVPRATPVSVLVAQVAGYVGYKFVAGFGLTVDLQLGAQHGWGTGWETTGTATGPRVASVDAGWGPAAHLNVGWSF